MLEVEDWTQPGSSKRRQNPKKSLLVAEPREDPPVALSAPPENEVEEESFHPARAPNSRHFPAARSGSNSTAPVAGPSSLSRLLAQAPATSEPLPVEPIPPPPVAAVPPPVRTPSPQPPVVSSSPASSVPASMAPGRQHPPNPSSPLRPGSRASRLSTSSRFSAPRLPAFGGAGGSAPKAVPTTAITAPPAFDEPGTGALGSIPSTAPLPTDSAGEGMASLLARRRTTSFHVPASGSPLAAPVPRETAGSAGAFASLASWGTSLRRRRTDVASLGSQAHVQAAARQDAAPGKGDARQILQQF
jgi:autophagy-related protein 11